MLFRRWLKSVISQLRGHRNRNKNRTRRGTERGTSMTAVASPCSGVSRVERLEDRSLLAVAVWDGGGSDNRWTMSANWIGDTTRVRMTI